MITTVIMKGDKYSNYLSYPFYIRQHKTPCFFNCQKSVKLKQSTQHFGTTIEGRFSRKAVGGLMQGLQVKNCWAGLNMVT